VFARLELDTCGAWVTLASGGHPLPILVRASGVIEERGCPGDAVGMFETVSMTNDRVGLGPGDALIFYTDGITESRDPHGELFGDNKLGEVLAAAVGGDAEALADAVTRGARSFGEILRDDVAVVVVRVPDELGADRLERVTEATGVPADELKLPDYPHGSPRPKARGVPSV
jgi:serine phosphatase RsbU (regulator of sigma subunit)